MLFVSACLTIAVFSEEFSFTTASLDKDSPFSIAIFGDMVVIPSSYHSILEQGVYMSNATIQRLIERVNNDEIQIAYVLGDQRYVILLLLCFQRS